jgi:chemotaxis receptor (MCP) glutamine deamidase CheD
MWGRKRTKAMIISRQPSPVQVVAVQKQLENMKSGSCFGSTITDDEKCTCKIKTMILMVRAAFKKMKTFHQQFDLHLTKKLVTFSIGAYISMVLKLAHCGK